MKRAPACLLAALLLLLSTGAAAQTGADTTGPSPVISDVPENGVDVYPRAIEPPVTTTDAPIEYSTEAQRAYLRSWLEYAAAAEQRQRKSAGVNGIIAGSLIMAIGISLYVSSSSSLDDFDRGVGIALIGGSSAFMAIGIFQLARKSLSELRLQRWYAADDSSLTAQELGRFEGELRAQSALATRAVRLQRWGNFGLFMGGALMLGLTPVSKIPDKETGYIVGGVAAGVGLIGFGFSFIGSPQEGYWKAYLAGQAPPQPRRWRAAPAAGRNYVGAQVSGTF